MSKLDNDHPLTPSVLINGLTNAMKFCQTGSIVVRLKSHPAKLTIEISDTGVGFDQSEMPLVLQPFKKLDKRSPGAGLGLHITKAILEKAGGSLSLRSVKGKGTTFEATMPVSWANPETSTTSGTKVLRRQVRPDGSKVTTVSSRNIDDDKADHTSTRPASTHHDRSPQASSLSGEASVPGSSIEAAEAGKATNPLRVLIVDDNHICLALLKMSLRKAPTHIELREANGGLQALDVFQEFRPDLVLTDVCMPGLDGIAAAEKMREFEEKENLPRSAIYAVTALGATDSRSRSKGLNGSADLDGWLVKGQDLAHIARDIAHRLSALGFRNTRSSSTAMLSSQTT